MKVNRFIFWMAKKYLNHGGNIGLKSKPDFHEYEKRLDIAPVEGCSDDRRYDIIYAKPENRKGIALFDIHGGAYVYSTRRHNHTYLNFFLEQGFDIVALDYPLGNGKIGTDDQFKAIYQELEHFVAHQKEYGLDEPCFLTGDSAGGHFALLLSEVLEQEEMRKELGLSDLNFKFQGVLLSCPVYDFAKTIASPGLSKGVRRQMWGKVAFDKELAKALDPRVHFPKSDIPVFLSSCKLDFIGENSALLSEDAKKLEKNLTYLYLDTDDKAVDHVHNVVKMGLPESRRVNQAMVEFILSCGKR